eukprot:6123793-Prymnesium_polylepis.1
MREALYDESAAVTFFAEMCAVILGEKRFNSLFVDKGFTQNALQVLEKCIVANARPRTLSLSTTVRYSTEDCTAGPPRPAWPLPPPPPPTNPSHSASLVRAS